MEYNNCPYLIIREEKLIEIRDEELIVITVRNYQMLIKSKANHLILFVIPEESLNQLLQ